MQIFQNLRNTIEKEGINGLDCSTTINSLNTATDMLNQPTGSSISITGSGLYFL